MSEIRKALGLPEPVEFQGQTWLLEPLTFLDLADAEALGLLKIGDAETLTTTSVLWLMLRKADPSLTETQRDLCQYTLTPRAVRALFTLQGDGGVEGVEFMGRVIAASGLNGSDVEAPDAEGDAGVVSPKDAGAVSPKKAARVPKTTDPATPTAA